MRAYFFKVIHYNSINETYTGYFLVFGLDTIDALERLKHNKDFINNTSNPGKLRVDQIEANEFFNETRISAFEIYYDTDN